MQQRIPTTLNASVRTLNFWINGVEVTVALREGSIGGMHEYDGERDRRVAISCIFIRK